MRLLYLYGEEMTGRRAREIHALNRARSLAESGVEVTLLFAEAAPHRSSTEILALAGLTEHENLKVVQIPRKLKVGPMTLTFSSYYYHQALQWISRQPRFDAAYVIHLKAVGPLHRKGKGIPIVFESHEIFADAYPMKSPRFLRLEWMEHQMFRQVRGVVVTSKYLLGELKKRHRLPESTLISPNCVGAAFFEGALDRVRSKQLLYLGSFQAWKGVATAVEAMKHLPEFNLIVIGGKPEEVNALKKGASANVRFLGFLKRDEFRPYLEEASIALIPNRLEPRNSLYTFPMKLIEYTASGKKIAATRLPVLEELQLGSWARLVPPDDSLALAQAIRELDAAPIAPLEIRSWAEPFRWQREAVRIRDFIGGLCGQS